MSRGLLKPMKPNGFFYTLTVAVWVVGASMLCIIIGRNVG